MIAYRKSSCLSLLAGAALWAWLGTAAPSLLGADAEGPHKPVIQKKGTLALDLVETTPFVFHDRLYRMEWLRSASCLRIMDAETGREVSRFGSKHRFPCAYVEKEVLYVVGTKEDREWYGNTLTLFVSHDLSHWTESVLFHNPAIGICNTALCRAGKRYVMSIELTNPGGFPARFLESTDLIHWSLLPGECRHQLGRYNAAHCLRWLDGWFYLFYLEAGRPHGYEQYVTRSRDLVSWETSPLNPVLAASPEDKQLANPNLTPEERERIQKATDANNSDIDFCEYQGRLCINYSWGNQNGTEFLAEAGYEGSLASFLKGWFPGAETAPPKPFGPVPSARQLKWHDSEFYAFLHFTVNTFTDQEWGYGDEKEALFNPTAFDADQIVRACQAAGMKGVILTAKHHDGFCLWPSKYTEHSVKNSPWKQGRGDAVAEISAACRRHGLKFGVYLSPWDRNHADYGRPAYVEYFRRQLLELLTHYGPIFEVWFDGANGGDGYYGGAKETRTIDRRTYYGLPELLRTVVHQLQPDACVFTEIGPEIRWVGNESGYAGEPCWATFTPRHRNTRQEIKIDPQTGYFTELPNGEANYTEAENGHRNGTLWIPAEVDVSIRPGWFYHASQDASVRKLDNLVKLYFESIGRGANLNLNVPPDRRGLLHENDVRVLAEFGQYLRATFGQDLAAGAKATASNVRGGDSQFGPGNLVDGQNSTYWSTDDPITTPEAILEFPQPVKFNVVRLREFLPLGQRVDDWAVDAWQNGDWKPIAKGTAIGACRLVRVPPQAAGRVRLRITQAPVCPAISEFGLFLEPDTSARPAAPASK
jgi:alpha-L-fucosidase